MQVPEGPVQGAVREGRAGRYRPDIDGLRAIAIVLVLLSHLGLKQTAGGYVGVDIFFVISGYLLTGNIADGLAAGTFSLAGFYERRLRRIVPALAVMLAVTSTVACLILPSRALAYFGESLFAAIFSYSNFYFYAQPDGYFSQTFTKLLLHTWSLGVEEQFYLVLPLCMLYAAKRSIAPARIVAVFGGASFLCAAYAAYAAPSFAFYMPYTRAWELLVGSALALGLVPPLASRALREAAAGFAILLILACLFTYTAATPFPGLAALPPCLAATLLIASGDRGTPRAVAWLSWRPCVFVGAISYSLYLWHWPVVLFLRLGIVPALNHGLVHGLALLKILLPFALAYLSWRFVERPFRTGRWKKLPRARVFASAGASAAALALVATAFVAGGGLPARFAPDADRTGNYLYGAWTLKDPACFIEDDYSAFDTRRCLAPQMGKRSVLLLGDSHAAALWLGFSRALPAADVLQATASSCPPVKGAYDGSSCGRLRRFVYERYLPAHRIDAVILTQAWSSAGEFDALVPALRWFRQRRIPVLLVGPVPDYTAPLPLLLALGTAWHVPGLARSRLVTHMGEVDRELRAKAAGRAGLHYASIWRAVCPADRCQEYADAGRDIPMLSDDSHLTDAGAILTVRRLQAAGELPV